MTQLDRWLPAYEFSEHHERRVRAPVAAVQRALHEIEVGRIPLVRSLMALRSLPAIVLAPRAALARRRRPQRAPRKLGIAAVDDFALLADEPQELVLGITGRFWKLAGELLPSDPATFRDPPPPGCARAAMSFLLTPRGERETLLATDTRIHCADEPSRRAFAWYWRAIRLGSGAIRHAMLHAVARHAERAASANGAPPSNP
jgi:hypothetical protein